MSYDDKQAATDVASDRCDSCFIACELDPGVGGTAMLKQYSRCHLHFCKKRVAVPLELSTFSQHLHNRHHHQQQQYGLDIRTDTDLAFFMAEFMIAILLVATVMMKTGAEETVLVVVVVVVVVVMVVGVVVVVVAVVVVLVLG